MAGSPHPKVRPLDVGVAFRAPAGEPECGDGYGLIPLTDGALVAVVDGLGHGREAAGATRLAVETIRAGAGLDRLESLFHSCHEALRGTRGAAISAARIDTRGERVTWDGVGNVEGILLTPPAPSRPDGSRETLLTRSGVVGYELPELRPSTARFGPGSCLVLATDGISPGFATELDPGRGAQATAEEILARYGRPDDDALVLVVMVA